MHGRHPERGAGDGQPQPRLLAACLQVRTRLTTPAHNDAEKHLRCLWLQAPVLSQRRCGSVSVHRSINFISREDSRQVCVLWLRRVTEFISLLEHSHFSDGAPAPLTAFTQSGQQGAGLGLGLGLGLAIDVDLGLEPSDELGPGSSHQLGQGRATVVQPPSIQELLRESGGELRGGGLMNATTAAKAVCTLSTQADR